MEHVTIRMANRQDVPLLLEFIKGIARYEKMEDEVIASGGVLERELFGYGKDAAALERLDGTE